MDVDAGLWPPRRPMADLLLRADARGRDCGVHEELTAGVVLGRSAFGGKPENMCTFRALPPLTPSGDSEAFTELAYRRQSTHRAMEAWYNPSIA